MLRIILKSDFSNVAGVSIGRADEFCVRSIEQPQRGIDKMKQKFNKQIETNPLPHQRRSNQ